MKVGARRLVYFVNFLAASGAVAALANCGGGERPQVSDTPVPDASKPPPLEAGASVTISGFDPQGGILFGDNGFVSCGTQASEKVITLKNNTSDVVNFTASLTSGDKFYKLNPPSGGGIPLHGQATIQITPQPIPQDSDVTSDLYAGVLELQFDNGDRANIRLHQTAQGAIIKSSIGSQIDFGNVKVNTGASQVLTLSNMGNADVSAELSVASQEFVMDGTAGAATMKVGANGTASKTITFKPSSVQAYTDQLNITFNSSAVFCKAPPGSLALKGTGTSSVTVTPGTLDFGQTSCGTAGTFQTVTIATTIDGSFTPTIAGGTTKYTLADSNGKPVDAGNPVPLTANVAYQLRVVPKPVPVPSPVTNNALGDQLTITTTAPGDTPHVVELKQTARGAILAVTPSTVTNTGSPGQVFNNALNIVNTGNAPADFTLALGDYQPAPSVATFSLDVSSGKAQVGSTPVKLQVTLPSTYNTPQLAKLALGISSSAVLCQDLPGKYPLQAETGAGTSITVNPGSLNFGQVYCPKGSDPATAAAPKDLTLTSIVDTTVTPTLGKGTSSPYTLEHGGVAVPLGTPVSLTKDTPYVLRVVPRPVERPSDTADNGLGDTLTLTSPIDPPKTISLSETARGAIFDFSPTSLICAKDAFCNFTLTNSGNEPGGYTITSTAGLINASGGPGTTTSGTLNSKTSFPGVLTAGTINNPPPATISVTTTATTNLCKDLPSPILVKNQ
jgi:hypothetical protein